MHVCFLVEVIMTRGIRAVVSDVAFNYTAIPSGDQTHIREPFEKHTTQGSHAGRIPMYHEREKPTGKMARIMPAFKLKFLCPFRILAACRRRIWIASIGANQTVDHEFE